EEQALVLGEGRDAVPDVARGKDLELLAQPPRRAAVVADGDDRGEAADPRDAGDRRVTPVRRDESLQACEERGEAGPSADADDGERRGACPRSRVQPSLPRSARTRLWNSSSSRSDSKSASFAARARFAWFAEIARRSVWRASSRLPERERTAACA